MKNLVVVKTFNTRIEAELAKGLLAANNIQSIIISDDEGGTAPFPFQPNSKGVQLMVAKADLVAAKSMLQSEERIHFKCPSCNKIMDKVNQDISHDFKKDRKYNRIIYHCKHDDVWINLEIPDK
jgi:hypothetical protein